MLAKELNMGNKSCSQIKISLAKLIKNFSKWLKWRMAEQALNFFEKKKYIKLVTLSLQV